MNCKYMNMLRVVRGNAFKLKIAVEAYTPSGRRIDSFALGEAVLKLDKNGTLTTKDYTILEGTTILVAFDGSESLGVYGFQMSGEYEGEAWRWANAEIFQIVESNVKAHIPEGCVLLDDTYNMALKIVLSGGDGVTFTPSVSEQGIISWTNDGGLPNPEPRNIRGPRGEQGPQGEVGPQGPRGQMGLRGQIGPKGDKGDKGDTGATPVLDVTASVDENVGNPMVVVESFGPAERRTFDFQFKNLKGQKGETGATGPQGPQGQQGEPGNYTKPASGIPLSDLNGNVASGIVYDVTANNSGATFASLSALLSSGSLSTLIPTDVRKGGMQIRFVQSSDNKYMQCRLMADSFTTDVTQWQGVDKEPIPNSHNLVESGSVFSQKASVSPGKNLFNIETSTSGKYFNSNGTTDDNPNYAISDYIKVESGQRYRVSADGDTVISNSSSVFICFYSSNKTFISSIAATNKNADAPNDASFMRISYQQNKTLIQVEKSSVGRTDYEPYNPIGGYKANVIDEQITFKKLAGYLQYAAKTVSYANGYQITKESIGSYISLAADSYIPISVGSRIKNNGIPVILGSNSSLTQRHDMSNGETWVAEFDVNEIRSGSTAGDLDIEVIGYGVKDGVITSNKLAEKAVTDGKVDDNAIDLKNLKFTSSVNLLDKTRAAVGKYIFSDGTLDTNPVYNTTDYIPVKPNTLYYIVSFEGRQRLPRMLCTYNYNKEKNDYIGTITKQYFTTGPNDTFIRVTYSVVDDSPSAWQYAQVTKSERLNYQEYSPMIPSSVILPDGSGVENVYFFLPKHIYVASGRTIEIYYDQILINASQYNIQAVCQIGKALERKFQIVGDSQHAGNNYTLTVNVFNNEGILITTGSSTIHIVSSEIATAKQILPIGDSLTNSKPWLTELHTLSANLTTVGTRDDYHEGRSGASVSTYTDVSGGIVYDFDREYRGPGYGTAPDFSESENYNAGDIVKTAYSTGYRYWVYKQNHSAGAFVQSECFCLSDGNPFYDYVDNKFSMSFYKTFYSKSYDAIILFLGTNGLNLTPETNPNGALGIKNLIELIREDEPTKPIVVVNTIFRSGQNGIGNQGNTDGYVAQSTYKFDADRKVLLLAKAIDDLCSSMANVYLCPVGATHDSKYNFGNNKTQVNPRLTSTDVVYELYPSDSVHPQTVGYMQMADEIFSTLCAVFNT